MRLSILTINEETRQIEVPDDSTLADLKALVARSFDMAESRFSLIFRGRNVKSNNDTLASMQIVDGSVLHFVPRIITSNTNNSEASQENPPTQERRPFALQYLEQFAALPFQTLPMINPEDGSIVNEVMDEMQRVVADLRRIETSSQGLLSSFDSSNMPSLFGAELLANFNEMLPLILESVTCVSQIFNNFNGMNHNNDVPVNPSEGESHRSHSFRVWNEFMEILRNYAVVLDMLSHSEISNDPSSASHSSSAEQLTVYRLRSEQSGPDAPSIYVGRRSGPSRSTGQPSDGGSGNATASSTGHGTASSSSHRHGTASSSSNRHGTASVRSHRHGTAHPGTPGQGPDVSAENQQGMPGTHRPPRSILINARVINSSNSADPPIWISSINHQVFPSRNASSQPNSDISSLSQDVQNIITNDINQFIHQGARLKYPNSIGFVNGFPRPSREIEKIHKASEKLTSLDRIVDNDRNILRLASSNDEFQDAFNEFLHNKNLNKMFTKYVAAKIGQRLNQ